MLQGIASLLIASFAALNPVAGNPGSPAVASGGATGKPVPTVSFVSNSPALIQQATDKWVTSIVIDVFPACSLDISYKLVTTAPPEVVTGRVTHLTDLGPNRRDAEGKPVTCGQEAVIPAGAPTFAQGYEVDLTFPVDFTSVPRSATLVLSKPRGLAAIPSVTLTLQRQVTLDEYLWIPGGCGAAMVALFTLSIFVFARRRNKTGADRRGPDPGNFWTRPVFASAAWTFKDSWATNLTVGVAAISAILSAFGATSTIFPGVRLDRYAVLMAACAAIIAIPPLIFGIFNTIFSSSRITLPDDSMIKPGGPIDVKAVAGGTLTLPGHQSDTVTIAPEDPQSGIHLEGGWIALAGDGTIVMSKGVTLTIGDPPAEGAAANPITVGDHGGTLKVVGVADITLPANTQIVTPAGATTLNRTASLKIPTAGNVIQSDMRSIIPAAAVTMFGIGAQLGILCVLFYGLSAQSGPARTWALAFLILAAFIVALYAGLTTRAMADARPGSALSGSSTSFTY